MALQSCRPSCSIQKNPRIASGDSARLQSATAPIQAFFCAYPRGRAGPSRRLARTLQRCVAVTGRGCRVFSIRAASIRPRDMPAAGADIHELVSESVTVSVFRCFPHDYVVGVAGASTLLYSASGLFHIFIHMSKLIRLCTLLSICFPGCADKYAVSCSGKKNELAMREYALMAFDRNSKRNLTQAECERAVCKHSLVVYAFFRALSLAVSIRR